MSRDGDLLLAFDFGLARIGIATGNRLTGTATPLSTLRSRGRLPWQEIDAVVDEWRPARIVVGLPSEDDANPLVQRIRSFVKSLQSRYAVPVETIDESHTSAEATARLREERSSGARRRVTRGTIDRHAACLIAVRWMQRRTADE